MPRYCAVKCCRNRGGNASTRENKRISFYPFPLQDSVRLQKWMGNMKQKEWIPSRHQYLCSEHFTEDCFDIRWGIRYLKNTAIPTIFPSIQNEEGKKKRTTAKIIPKTRTRTCDTDTPASDSPLNKRPLILTRTVNPTQSTCANSMPLSEDNLKTDSIHPDLDELPVAPNTCPGNVSLDGALLSETSTDALGLPGQSCMQPASHLIQLHEDELHHQGDNDSMVTVLCCESLNLLSDNKMAVDSSAEYPQAFSFVPVELIRRESVDCLEDGALWEAEQISVDEHSYCRAGTDKEQLWGKILSLHTKIIELDHREEITVARIHALEREIVNMKRDSTAFREKQKALEDYI